MTKEQLYDHLVRQHRWKRSWFQGKWKEPLIRTELRHEEEHAEHSHGQ